MYDNYSVQRNFSIVNNKKKEKLLKWRAYPYGRRKKILSNK